MILDRHQLAQSKIELLEKGLSAYTDSAEVARLVKREIRKKNMDVLEETTPIGSWFIPKKVQNLT